MKQDFRVYGGVIMKKTLFWSIFIIMVCAGISANANYNKDDISKVVIAEKDIPQGFIIGKMPDKVKDVLKDNPWYFDNEAIKKLTGHIYPDGDYKKVAVMHMTILADKEKPYKDNIVCWIILYKDSIGAKEEMAKLKRHTDFNSDRCILIQKNNMAVLMYARDINDFRYVQGMAAEIQTKMKAM